MSTTEAAIQSLEKRKITVPNLHVLKHGVSNETETCVHRVINIPIPLDGKHAYYENATSFDHVKLSNTVDPLLFFLQFCVLMVENTHHIGGYDCIPSYRTDPGNYRATVSAVARIMRGKGTASDKDRKNKNTKMHAYVDLRFTHDIEQEIRQQDFDEIQAKKNRSNKKKGDGKDAENKKNDANPNKKQRVEPAIVQPPPPPPSETYDDFMSHFFFGKIKDVDQCLLAYGYNGRTSIKPGSGNSVYERMTDEQLRFDCTDFRSVLDYGEDKIREMHTQSNAHVLRYATDLADRAKAEAQQVEINRPVRTEYQGPGRVNKIDFTITSIPHATIPGKIAGMMARFLIRDTSINTGLFFDDILRNLDRRKDAEKQGKRGKVHEMFPDYLQLFNSFHPAGNNTSADLYGRCALQLKPELSKHSKTFKQFMRDVDYSNDTPFNMVNFFNVKYALDVLEKAGCDPTILGTPETWWKEITGMASFPKQPTCKTYKYLPQQVFWYHPKNVGLREQLFPHVDAKTDFIKRFTNGENMADYFKTGQFVTEADGSKMLNDAFSSVERLLTEEIVVSRAKLTESKLVSYDTNNEFIHKAVEAELIYKQLEENFPAHYETTLEAVELRLKHFKGEVKFYKDRMPEEKKEDFEDYLKRVEQCEYYNKLVTTTQESLMKVFQTLFQLEGNIDALPISEPVKTILKWYRNNHQTKLPNMTREYVSWDPELDIFGNTMIQQLSLYVSFAGILQPVICLLSEGLFSCYDSFMKELSFHMMIHGRYDTGKTYTAIKTLIEFTCIQDAVAEYSLNTKAADTTRNHAYDEIVASDECPRWMTSEKEAELNQEQVDKEKIKFTRGQITLNSFVWVNLPNGDRIRWNEKTTCDHKKACVFVTNASVESKRALSSRMFRITVKQSNTPANEMKGKLAACFKTGGRLWLNINQFLSVCGKKAAAVGAILPEVEMSLFDDISNRVLFYLRGWKVIGDDVGPRSLDIMRPYLRQLIYKMAIRYAFDLPSSPNYKKKFTVDMIKEIQPYLYCTVEMVWWVWTVCATEWVDDDNSNVLRALICDTGSNWEQGENAYDIFAQDVDNKVKFRLRRNPEAVTDKDGPNQLPADQYLIDLQYLAVEGTIEQISKRIAQYTNPRMSETDISSVITRLKSQMHTLETPGFKPQPKGTFERWHRYLELPVGMNDGKKLLQSDLHKCPKAYLKGHSNPAVDMRKAEHVDREPENKQMPIIDDSDLRKHDLLYFMPSAISAFQNGIIQEALFAATICSTIRPGKYLLGFADHTDSTRLMVTKLTKQFIDDFVDEEDKKSGFKISYGKPVFIDQSVPKRFRPTSRREGITFNHRVGMTASQAVYMTARPWEPTKEGDNSWQERYKQGAEAMSKTVEVVYDMNAYSARKQHMRCGRPLYEPVRTPTWIQEQYEKGCEKKKIDPDLDMDYPNDIVKDATDSERMWRVSSGIIHGKQNITTGVKTCNKLPNREKRPRKENEREPPNQSKTSKQKI